MVQDLKYYLPGISLLFFGVIVLVFPEILVGLIAGLTIMAGGVALYLGHFLKRSRIRIAHPMGDPWEEDLFAWPFAHPLFFFKVRSRMF